MSRPKKDWRVEFHLLNKMYGSLLRDNESNLRELNDVNEQYQKSKQYWNSQEDRMQREIYTLSKQAGNLHNHNKNLTHAISVLSEQLRSHEINNERYSMFDQFNRGENTCLVEAPQMAQRNK